jgi:hypothetical protein
MLVVRGGIAEASWPHLATTGGSPFLRGSPLTRGEEELYRRDAQNKLCYPGDLVDLGISLYFGALVRLHHQASESWDGGAGICYSKIRPWCCNSRSSSMAAILHCRLPGLTWPLRVVVLCALHPLQPQANMPTRRPFSSYGVTLCVALSASGGPWR